MTHSAIICIGSNVHPRQKHILEAAEKLAQTTTIHRQSSISQTDDITGRGEPYLNMVIDITTEASHKSLNDIIIQIEQLCGRTPERSDRGIVDIDIDIVIWDGSIVKPDDFTRPFFYNLYKQIL